MAILLGLENKPIHNKIVQMGTEIWEKERKHFKKLYKKDNEDYWDFLIPNTLSKASIYIFAIAVFAGTAFVIKKISKS